MQNSKKSSWVKESLIYLSTSLALFGFFVWSYPSLSTRAEPFAETVSSYFAEFHGQTALIYLLSKDFGYFGLIPRAIFFALASVFGERAFPELIQTVTLLVVSFTIALFILNPFSKVVERRSLRLMMVLLVASGLEYGIFLLHNVGYCFVFPACYALALFVGSEKKRLSIVIISILTTAFLWSKGYSVAAIPALLYGAFDRMRRKDYFSAGCFLMILLASMPQFLSVFVARGTFGSESVPAFTIVRNVLYFYVYAWKHFTIGGNTNYVISHTKLLGIVLTILAIWLAVLLMPGRRGNYVRSAFIGAQILALGGIGVAVLAMYKRPVDIFYVPNFIQDSYFFCTQVSILFSTGMFLSFYLQKISRCGLRSIAIAFVLYRMGITSYASSHLAGGRDPYGDKRDSFSDWNLYRGMVRAGELGCVPYNPPGSFFPSCEQAGVGVVKINTKDGGIYLTEMIRAPVKGVCFLEFDPEISEIEVRTKGDIFKVKSLREQGSKHPCFKWPGEVLSFEGVSIFITKVSTGAWQAKPEKIFFIH